MKEFICSTVGTVFLTAFAFGVLILAIWDMCIGLKLAKEEAEQKGFLAGYNQGREDWIREEIRKELRDDDGMEDN